MKQNRTASYAITKLIGELEGFSPTMYRCPTGYKTIGYGHVVQDVDMVFKEVLNFTSVLSTTIINEEQALLILKHDIAIFEKGINKTCPHLNQQEFDACVCFAFNMGLGAFNSSTLAKLINQDLKEEASLQFARWVYGTDNSGVPTKLLGLQKRREVERLIFVSGEKTPKIDRSKFTRGTTSQITDLYSNYASRLFIEHNIKIELEA